MKQSFVGYLFLCLLLLDALLLAGQNLVPNNTFDQHSKCPDGSGNFYCSSWSSFGGNPEYFNGCATDTAYGIPMNKRGGHGIYLTNSYCALLAYTTSAQNKRDYLGAKLIKPMIPGQAYTLCAHFSNCSGSNCAVDKLGFQFSTKPHSKSNPLNPSNQPAAFQGTIVKANSGTWTSFGVTYIADSAYTYVAYGNFFDDQHTDTLNEGPIQASGYSSYYYVGDLGVVPLTISGYYNNDCSNSCSGSINAQADGGLAPYTYSWSHNASLQTGILTNLCSGTYTLTLKDSLGTTVSKQYSIRASTPIRDSLLVANPKSCNCTGKITILAKGGTKPYTYTWTGPVFKSDTNPSFAGLCPGFYTVYVTDSNQCQGQGGGTYIGGSNNVGLYLNGNPGAVIHRACPGSCNGSLAAVVYGGRPPFSYTWSTVPPQYTDTATQLCLNTYYKVSVTDSAGCLARDSILFTAASHLSVQLMTDSLVFCQGQCDTLRSSATGSTAYQYSWAPQTGLQAPNSSTTVVCPISSGVTTYTLTVTGSDGCSVKAHEKVQENVCTGIETNSTPELIVQIRPNPSRGHIWIQVVETRDMCMQLNVTDVLGRNVLRYQMHAAEEQIDLSHLDIGIYVISYQTPSGKFSSQKIVIQRSE
jgi:hypothetical protein